MENKKFSGYTVAVGLSITAMMMQGAFGTFGIFLPYIIASEGWSVSAVSFMSTCCSIVVFIISTNLYTFISKLGAKKVLLIGVICCGLHYQFYGLSRTIWQLYLSACVGGLAMGFATNATLSMILTRWFVDKRARVISLVMMPTGFGGALFSFISGRAIELLGNWRTAYHVIGALVWLIAIPIVLIMVKESPAAVGQLPLGSNEQVEDAGPKAKVKLRSLPEIKTLGFWLMWVGLFCCGFVSPSLSQHFTSILRNGGIEAGAASNYVAIAKAFTAFAYLVLGWISGNKGNTKVVVTLITATLVLACISLYVIDGVPATGLMTWAIVAMLSFGFGQTSVGFIATNTVMDAYGPKRYAVVFGIFQGAMGFAGAFGSVVLGMFKENFGSYQVGLIVYAILSVLSMVLVFSAIKSAQKSRAQTDAAA